MGEVARIDLETGEVTEFRPQEAKPRIEVHKKRIELAAALDNTEAMEAEIDRLLDAQEDVVRWWDANVRGAGKPVIISDSEIITAAQAEKIIGFSAVQVSRWAKALADREIARVRRQS